MTSKVHFHLLVLHAERARKLRETENSREQPQNWTSINIYWAGVSTVCTVTQNALFIPWVFSRSSLEGRLCSWGSAGYHGGSSALLLLRFWKASLSVLVKSLAWNKAELTWDVSILYTVFSTFSCTSMHWANPLLAFSLFLSFSSPFKSSCPENWDVG